MLRELMQEVGRALRSRREDRLFRAQPGFTVMLIRPEGYQHTEVFREIAETLFHGLQSLGYRAAITENTVTPGAIPIILGSHMLREGNIPHLPESSILYNFEQIHPGVEYLQTFLHVLAPRFRVWDYSRRNIEELGRLVAPRSVRHVPLGYCPELVRVPRAPEQDIDVFFSGALSERRSAVLDELRRAGLNVVNVSSVYGAERDALIARSRVVLNVRYREQTKIFEMARVFYLLANSKAVVSECDAGTEIDESIRRAVRAVPYGELVEATRALARDAQARAALEEQGHEIFAAQPESAILAGAIAGVVPAAPAAALPAGAR